MSDHTNGKRTVLLVDDSAPMRESLQSLLVPEFPEMCFRQARTGEEALDCIGEGLVDVVLMDVGLPGMNGIEAIRRIKLAFPEVKVMIVSGRDWAAYRAHAEAAGASAWVSKQRVASDLAPALAGLLPQTRAGQPGNQPGRRI